MRHLFSCILLFVLTCSSNYAFMLASGSELLSPFEVAPQACVANRVDATSGMYFEEEQDYTLASVEDLVLRRYYSSNWDEWRFFPQCALLQGRDKEAHKEVALTFDSNGTEFRLFCPISDDSKSSRYQFRFKAPLQNLSRGCTSGKAHFSDCFGSLHHDLFKLTLPDGTLRTYKEVSSAKRDLGPLCLLPNSDNVKDKTYFRLVSERLSTGNELLYQYEKEGFLHSIELVDKKEKSYAKLIFQYSKNKVQVFNNNKMVASYQFVNGLLTEVVRAQKPNNIYTYKRVNGKNRLIKKDLPEGRFIGCSYDEQGRVLTFATSAMDSPLYRFQYGVNKTEVTDSNNNKTIFCYQDRRLTSCEFYEGKSLQRKDTYIWNEPNESGIHTLKGYTLQDWRGRVVQGTRYEYLKNDKTRVVHQDIYKASDESPANMINLGPEGLPTGKKTRQSSYFSLDRPWHLRYEEDEHGNRITYRYASNSSLLEEKFVEKEKKIIRREFYEYDDAAALVKAIVDDGSHDAPKDVSGVLTRTVRKIKPKNFRTPCEEEIEEWRYDPETEKEYLVHAIKHSFDPDGNLIKRELYDTEGKKAKTEEFAFDAHGNCIRKANAQSAATHYHFDANDNCIQIEAPGVVTSFTYDLADRQVSTKECYSDGATALTRRIFDATGNQIASIDRYGNQTDYAYDIFGRCTSITHPRVLVVSANNTSWCPKEYFQYDLLGNCILKTDPNGHKEEILYNVNGQKLSVKYPDATTEHFFYTATGKLKQKLNKNGTITAFRYDSKNNLSVIETSLLTEQKKIGNSLSSIQFAYSKGRCTEEKGSNGTTLVKTYDAYGRLQSETEKSSKSKKEYKYDTLHRPVRIKRWIDEESYLVECFKYDVLDRIIEKWVKEPDGSKTALTSYSYDAFGNVTTTTTGLATEHVQYIEGTRPHLITNIHGGVTRIDYNESRNTLGQRHLQLCTTDPRGVITVIEYDALGREVEETIKDPFGIIISSQKKLYDSVGNIERIEEVLLPTQERLRFEWTYGPMHRMLSKKDGDMRTENTFNDKGELVKTSGNSGTFSYEYTQTGMGEGDKKGKVQKVCKDAQEVSTFAYDKSGNVVGGTCDGKGVTKREYTPQGKIASEMIRDEWGSYTLEYSYDRLGRMTKVRLPDKSYIKYVYVGSTLQAVIRKTKDGEEAYLHEYTKYNEQGQPIEEKLFTQQKRMRSYDSSGALTALETTGISESIVERDSIGNPTKIQRGAKSVSYAYDYLGRLIEEKGDQTESYEYDSLNNVLSHNNAKASYNKRNQLVKKEAQVYSYDNSDNVSEISSDSSQAHLGYTANCQLTSYTNSKTQDEVEYHWDVYGRQTLRKERKSVHRMFFIGNCEIGALNKDGDIIELKVPERIVGEEAQGAIAIELKKHIYLPISDLLGNISALYCPRAKSIVESYEYTAFGKERIFDEKGQEHSRSSLSNPWRYRAHRTDPITHFVCFGFRDYDPSTKRFLTPDPLGYVDGLNQYAYALNNPIVYTDVYGLKARYGACTCHSSCEYYTTGVCGHGGGVLLDDDSDDEQEKIASELDSRTSSNIWRVIDDGLEAWDTASNAAILAGAAGTPMYGAGLPVLGCGIVGKVSGRVAKVAMPAVRKLVIATTPVIRKIQAFPYYSSIDRTIRHMRNVVASKVGFDTKQANHEVGEFLFKSWSKGTFPNRMQSIKYHLGKHGNGRTYKEYTQNALDFFKLNKDKAIKLTLKNGNAGYSIKLKENGTRIGGFWSENEEIITFWD